MIGSPRVHHLRTDSTNIRARELAIRGAPHGTLVTAAEQTAGRGRQGRSWVAPPGSSVLASIVLRDLATSHSLLPLAAAVAVCEACEAAAPAVGPVAIKWPNDVWIGRRKVAGILLEGRPQEGWAVVGVGLNVTTARFPQELRETATSLALEGAPEAEVERVLTKLLETLDQRLGDPPGEAAGRWRERDALRGERVRYAGGEGAADGIDDAGGLIVIEEARRVTLDAGEVHLLR